MLIKNFKFLLDDGNYSRLERVWVNKSTKETVWTDGVSLVTPNKAHTLKEISYDDGTSSIYKTKSAAELIRIPHTSSANTGGDAQTDVISKDSSFFEQAIKILSDAGKEHDPDSDIKNNDVNIVINALLEYAKINNLSENDSTKTALLAKLLEENNRNNLYSFLLSTSYYGNNAFRDFIDEYSLDNLRNDNKDKFKDFFSIFSGVDNSLIKPDYMHTIRELSTAKFGSNFVAKYVDIMVEKYNLNNNEVKIKITLPVDENTGKHYINYTCMFCNVSYLGGITFEEFKRKIAESALNANSSIAASQVIGSFTLVDALYDGDSRLTISPSEMRILSYDKINNLTNIIGKWVPLVSLGEDEGICNDFNFNISSNVGHTLRFTPDENSKFSIYEWPAWGPLSQAVHTPNTFKIKFKQTSVSGTFTLIGQQVDTSYFDNVNSTELIVYYYIFNRVNTSEDYTTTPINIYTIKNNNNEYYGKIVFTKDKLLEAYNGKDSGEASYLKFALNGDDTIYTRCGYNILFSCEAMNEQLSGPLKLKDEINVKGLESLIADYFSTGLKFNNDGLVYYKVPFIKNEETGNAENITNANIELKGSMFNQLPDIGGDDPTTTTTSPAPATTIGPDSTEDYQFDVANAVKVVVSYYYNTVRGRNGDITIDYINNVADQELEDIKSYYHDTLHIDMHDSNFCPFILDGYILSGRYPERPSNSVMALAQPYEYSNGEPFKEFEYQRDEVEDSQGNISRPLGCVFLRRFRDLNIGDGAPDTTYSNLLQPFTGVYYLGVKRVKDTTAEKRYRYEGVLQKDHYYGVSLKILTRTNFVETDNQWSVNTYLYGMLNRLDLREKFNKFNYSNTIPNMQLNNINRTFKCSNVVYIPYTDTIYNGNNFMGLFSQAPNQMYFNDSILSFSHVAIIDNSQDAGLYPVIPTHENYLGYYGVNSSSGGEYPSDNYKPAPNSTGNNGFDCHIHSDSYYGYIVNTPEIVPACYNSTSNGFVDYCPTPYSPVYPLGFTMNFSPGNICQAIEYATINIPSLKIDDNNRPIVINLRIPISATKL